jgi:hypothetical protein
LDDLDNYRENRVVVKFDPNLSYGCSRKNNVLRVVSDIRGDTEGGVHNQVMEFDVTLSSSKKKGWWEFYIGEEPYWVKPITDDSDIRVHCSCTDYYFSFWMWNKKGNSHYGEDMKPYTPVGGSNRPPKNPNHYMGMCKHLLRVLTELKKLKLVAK